MKSFCARAATTLAVVLGLGMVQPSYALPPLDTPYQLLQNYEFQAAGAVPADWDIVTGSWVADGRTYVTRTAARRIIANKHVEGTIRGLASGTYTAAANTSVTLELRCINNKTSVLVNAVRRVSGILHGQLRGGRGGVITRSTQGRFDDIVFDEIN